MKVLLAESMGMCFGVKDALEQSARVEDPAAVTIHGELVHNPAVLVELTRRGFRINSEAARGEVPETETVLITAHGISHRQRARLEAASKTLIDTTCPLVRKAHEAALGLGREGFHVLVIGKRGHVEVEGLTGDLESFDVIENVGEAREYPSKRLGIVCQTTCAQRDVEAIRGAIAARNPQAEIHFIDTVCQPTKDRQLALDSLLGQVDAMVVVGGFNSNNTRKLLQRCRERGVPAFQVQSADELRGQWFRGIETVGLTAGTSTLDQTIEHVHRALLRIGERSIMHHHKTEGPLRAWSSRQWCEYFRENAAALMEIPWENGAGISDGERDAIAASVQEFQLGESGDGKHFLACADRHSARCDALYGSATRLFIAEEHRHARELGRFLDLAGVAHIRHAWADAIFRWLRHRAGLELSISVLVTAEIIAQVYYVALGRATGSAVMRTICRQIIRDELQHVRFQAERLAILRARRGGLSLAVTHALHRFFFAGVCLVFWRKHSRAMRAGGYGLKSFWKDAHRKLNKAIGLMDPRSYRQHVEHGTIIPSTTHHGEAA